MDYKNFNDRDGLLYGAVDAILDNTNDILRLNKRVSRSNFRTNVKFALLGAALYYIWNEVKELKSKENKEETVTE